MIDHPTEVCQHQKCRPPNGYDHDRCNGLRASEVRKLFPRFWGPCPDCGAHVIQYCSVAHFTAGDW